MKVAKLGHDNKPDKKGLKKGNIVYHGMYRGESYYGDVAKLNKATTVKAGIYSGKTAGDRKLQQLDSLLGLLDD